MGRTAELAIPFPRIGVGSTFEETTFAPWELAYKQEYIAANGILQPAFTGIAKATLFDRYPSGDTAQELRWLTNGTVAEQLVRTTLLETTLQKMGAQTTAEMVNRNLDALHNGSSEGIDLARTVLTGHFRDNSILLGRDLVNGQSWNEITAPRIDELIERYRSGDAGARALFQSLFTNHTLSTPARFDRSRIEQQVAAAHVEKQLVRADAIRLDAPDEAFDLLTQMLEEDPDVAQLLEALGKKQRKTADRMTEYALAGLLAGAEGRVDTLPPEISQEVANAVAALKSTSPRTVRHAMNRLTETLTYHHEDGINGVTAPMNRAADLAGTTYAIARLPVSQRAQRYIENTYFPRTDGDGPRKPDWGKIALAVGAAGGVTLGIAGCARVLAQHPEPTPTPPPSPTMVRTPTPTLTSTPEPVAIYEGNSLPPIGPEYISQISLVPGAPIKTLKDVDPSATHELPLTPQLQKALNELGLAPVVHIDMDNPDHKVLALVTQVGGANVFKFPELPEMSFRLPDTQAVITTHNLGDDSPGIAVFGESGGNDETHADDIVRQGVTTMIGCESGYICITVVVAEYNDAFMFLPGSQWIVVIDGDNNIVGFRQAVDNFSHVQHYPDQYADTELRWGLNGPVPVEIDPATGEETEAMFVKLFKPVALNLPTPTPTETPTATVTPEITKTRIPTRTPTEVPFWTGELGDIREPLARGYLYVNPTVDTYPGISGYGFTFGFDINLVSTAKLPESSAITEWIWGFNLGPGKDYRFIINSVPCQLIRKDGIPIMLGNMKDSYEIGKIYNPTFAGLRKPFDPTKIPQGDCTQVWGELQPDPAGVTKLQRFFTIGDSSEFPVIEVNGLDVVDLRNVITLAQIH